MRILVVDDSAPHRRLLTAILGRVGHEVVTASDGVDALAVLERSEIDGVVSDVRMPRMDGYQLLRALRGDPRWASLPFIFYSSVFIDKPAQTLGLDLGATAYLDAKDVEPAKVAEALQDLVNRHLRAEYRQTIGRLLDDVEFARRYHQVMLSQLTAEGQEDIRDLVVSSAQALDEVVSRLDVERRALAEDAERVVESAEVTLLKELAEHLGDKINNPLAVILGNAEMLSRRVPSDATDHATRRIREAVDRINSVVLEIGRRSERARRTRSGAPRPPSSA
jgi:CheY-like chemotaxis protein